MKERWYIHVSGYGGFDFEGTREEALQMRAHKARWEHGIAHLWRVGPGGHFVKEWGGEGLWPYPPTFESDRAEMLTALGLAWGIKSGGFASLIATAIADRSGPVDRSAFMGAHHVMYGYESNLYDEVADVDAYVAGAAVAMALEEDAP